MTVRSPIVARKLCASLTVVPRHGWRAGPAGLALAASLLILQPDAANAQCVNTAGTVVCGADDTNGFFSAADLTSITVDNGVTVDDTGNGGAGAAGGLGFAIIEIDDFFGAAQADVTGAFIVNGIVTDTGAPQSAIFVEGIIGGGFINTGTISGGVDALTVLGNAANMSIIGGFVNTGTMTGTGRSGVFSADISGGFRNLGTIVGGANAVDTFDITGGFVNSGTIRGGADGVNVFDVSGGFINSGTISGVTDGVDTRDVSGGFSNSGTITGGTNGVDTLDVSGRFSNSGTITGANNGVDTLEISGGFFNTGTITGTGNDALNTTDISGGFSNTGTLTAEDDAVDTSDISGGFFNSGRISGADEGVNITGTVTGDFTNTGTIVGTAGDGVDISMSLFGSFSNSGTIRGGDDGVDIDGHVTGDFTNSGTINGGVPGGVDTNGVDVDSVAERFLNTGTITGTDAAIAIEDGTIAGGFDNSGTITGDSDGNGTGAGVEIATPASTSTELINRMGGRITGAVGIDTEAGSETLINDGFIEGTGGTSIDLGAGDDILDLRRNSVIVGLIDLGAGMNTLNVASRFNLDATFVGGPPTIGTTNGSPFVVAGSRVIVVDPTGFAAPNLFLGDLTGAVLNVLDYGPGGEMPNSVPVQAFWGGLAGDADAQVHAWASGFGGARTFKSAPGVGIDHGFGGFTSGLEARFGGSATGVFGGGAWSRASFGDPTPAASAKSVFGGIYYRTDVQSHWFNLSVTGGWTGHENKRRIANNLVPGGIENASGDFGGWFVSPAATFGTTVAEFAGRPILASIRVNYTAQSFNGYSETGVAAPLTVAGQAMHTVATRAKAAIPMVWVSENGDRTKLEGYGGVEGRFQLGSRTLNATVVGLPIGLPATFDDEMTGFAGAAISRSVANGMGLISATVEGRIDFEGGYGATGHLKATRRF